MIASNSTLHSNQDREGKRAATSQYMKYGEEQHSVADKGIGLNATWKDVFDFLSADEFALLAPHLRERALASGERFFAEGERNDQVAFVLTGRLAVRKPTEFPGRWQTIALLSAGAVVGEGGLLDDDVHGATVEALEESRLLLCDRQGFEAVVAGAPGVAVKILRYVLSIATLRLRMTSHRLSLVL